MAKKMQKKHICSSLNLNFFKSIFHVVLWSLIIGSSGCAVDPVAPDLVTYVNQGILNISALEKKAFESYASVTGQNYTSDEAVFNALKDDVIPTYSRYIYLLKKIEVDTLEVLQLHRIYIQGAELLEKGFRTKMSGIENENVNLINRGNSEIEAGYAITEKWRSELTTLYKAHGVKIDTIKK